MPPGVEPDCKAIVSDLTYAIRLLERVTAAKYKPSAAELKRLQTDVGRRFSWDWVRKRRAHYQYDGSRYPRHYRMTRALWEFQEKFWEHLRRFAQHGSAVLASKYTREWTLAQIEKLRVLISKPISECKGNGPEFVTDRPTADSDVSAKPSMRNIAMRAVAARRPAVVDKKAVRKILREVRWLVKAGLGMDRLRKTHPRKCVHWMTVHQRSARRLKKRLDPLAFRAQLELAQAVGNLEMCVSCLLSASSYCRIAQQGVRSAEKALKTK